VCSINFEVNSTVEISVCRFMNLYFCEVIFFLPMTVAAWSTADQSPR
jgi:hypothetical protein